MSNLNLLDGDVITDTSLIGDPSVKDTVLKLGEILEVSVEFDNVNQSIDIGDFHLDLNSDNILGGVALISYQSATDKYPKEKTFKNRSEILTTLCDMMTDLSCLDDFDTSIPETETYDDDSDYIRRYGDIEL